MKKIKILIVLLSTVFLLTSCNNKSKNSSLDNSDFKSLVINWDKAHNSKDVAAFSNLFDSSVLFYGTKLDKNTCIENKLSFFKKYPDFYEQIYGDIQVEKQSDNSVKCSFIKRVTLNQVTKDYPSYLIFKKVANDWKIITEGDLVTDKILSKNSNESKENNELIKKYVGNNTVINFDKDLNQILYKKLENKSKTKGQEGEESFDQYSIRLYNINSNNETILFTTCLDGNGGTMPDYANSNKYPFSYLCGIEKIIFSKDVMKIFIQTSGWAVCPAIHYYDIKLKKLVFFSSGWLLKTQKDGVVIDITGLDMVKKNGEMVSSGRYTQTCLYDFNGHLIKKLSKKK